MDAHGEYLELMNRANVYHQRALWQQKLGTLQPALAICVETGFPEAEQCRQQVLYEIGGTRRRFGQIDQALQTLQQALQASGNANPIVRAKILGELGILYKHKSEYSRARAVFMNNTAWFAKAAKVLLRQRLSSVAQLGTKGCQRTI